jgi:hypothetical protein
MYLKQNVMLSVADKPFMQSFMVPLIPRKYIQDLYNISRAILILLSQTTLSIVGS